MGVDIHAIKDDYSACEVCYCGSISDDHTPVHFLCRMLAYIVNVINMYPYHATEIYTVKH